MDESFFQAVASNGVPVAVAAFLLLRMEKELKMLRVAIERLRHCQTCRFSEFDEKDGKGKP